MWTPILVCAVLAFGVIVCLAVSEQRVRARGVAHGSLPSPETTLALARDIVLVETLRLGLLELRSPKPTTYSSSGHATLNLRGSGTLELIG
jgi:hypothetical protein